MDDNPFSGVIDTLADSLLDHSSVSIHDILDAYTTFSNRIRLYGSCDASLTVFKVHKDSFIGALRRDVRLAHVDPLTTREMSPGITMATRQYARDSSSLCLRALCVLSTILRFPPFHSVFSEHDLSTLLGDVLDITLADELPSLNVAKTYSFSLWTLSCHRLPEAILSSRRDDVRSALQRSLDSTRHPPAVILNGIKSISHTLERYPCAFLHLLAPLLPNLMSNLRAESSDLRLHASIALGKFAYALVSNSDLSLANWESLSNHLIPFLESNCGDSKPGNTNFQHIVRTAFSIDSHACPGHPPTWILVVLASLILLCGPTLYSRPIVLRFILQSLALALTHKRSVIRALHSHVWRCFLSTFSCMLSEHMDPALISAAFHAIKQEVGGGIGAALANVLLSHQIQTVRPDERRDRVSRALSVIKAMTQTDCGHTRREGFMYLQAFTNDTQARHQITQDMCETPALILLDGVIAGTTWDSLPSTIHSIPKIPIEVHWLDEKEIAQNYKMLLDTWKIFATKVERKDSDSSLVDVWSAILLACSHQMECGQHVSITTELLIQSAAMIAEFLPPAPPAEHQPDWGSWSVHDQLSRLAFIEQLWSAMRRAFITSSLSEAAELILASVLKLCADLMVTASPSFLRDTRDHTAPQTVIRDQRELWGIIATSLSSSSEHGVEWQSLVKFLSIPICCWVLSKPELEAWEALFRNAILVAGSSAIAASTTILCHFREKEAEKWESILPVLSFFLMYARGHDVFPTEELFSLLDVCLTVSYSQARHSSEALTRSLELLSMIRDFIVSTPDRVMLILQALRNSLCLWIEDHFEVMATDEFNTVAVSLYCEILKALEVLPLSVQSLQGMETFLASAFSRIPTPAIAPFAFEKFWKATYHGHSRFCDNLPPKIKSCLICFVAAYGGDLADGLSLTTESQSQSISTSSSQARFPTSQQQDVLHVGAVTPYERQEMFTAQEDTALLFPSLDDDVHHPTALRRLQEYSSRIDMSSQNESKRSTGGSQIRTPSDLATSDAVPRSHYRKTSRPVITHVSNQKRKLAHSVDAPRKRSKTSPDILRVARKSESEPATRDVTPMDTPCMNSMPLRETVVLGGVRIPTLHAITRRRKRARRVGTSQSRASSLSSMDSGEDSFDWEDFRVDAQSSEVDADQSLLDAQPSSPPPTLASTSRDTPERWSPHSHSSRISESDLAPDVDSEPGPAKAGMSQNDITPSAPPRPSLRRAKTASASARLDALQDVYSAVANGGSQIPMSELVHATRLVHQIGAALTEKMGKKVGGPG